MVGCPITNVMRNKRGNMHKHERDSNRKIYVVLLASGGFAPNPHLDPAGDFHLPDPLKGLELPPANL